MSDPARRWPPAARVAPGLSDEFPGLYLRHLLVDRGSGRSPRGLKQRLRLLSDRFAGAQAISDALAADPVGVPRLLPPHRARPRRAADPGRGS